MNATTAPQMPPAPPAHLRSRQLLGVAKLLGLLIAILGAAFLAYAAQEIRSRHQSRIEFEARVLEQQCSDFLNGAENLLRSLQHLLPTLSLQPELGDTVALDSLSAQLRLARQGQNFVRSLSWLDAQGHVLASSDAGNSGAGDSDRANRDAVQLDQLLPSKASLQAAKAAPAGRALLQLPLAAAEGQPLTLLLPSNSGGRPGYLLALLTPEYLAGRFERQLQAGGGGRALLLERGGHLVLSTQAGLAAGTSLSSLPAFVRHLAADQLSSVETTPLEGPGSDGRRALSAIRATPDWPLLVLVEQPYSALFAELWPLGRWTLAFALVGWGGLIAGTLLARRALLADEAMRGDLAQANAATRASELRKLAILQSSLDGIISIDAMGFVLDFNAAAERIFGYTAAAVLGQPMHSFLLPPQHREAHQKGLQRLSSGGKATLLNRRIEVEALCADGRIIPVELTIVPVKKETGEIFTATLRDISERIKTEQALRASRELLDKTGRIGSIGGWEFDVHSHDLRWTEETLRIHDLEPGQQPTLQEAIEFFAPEAQAPLREAMQLSIARGEGFDLELPLITAKGRKLWVRAVSRADMQDGKPVRLSGAIQDITARRRFEAELAAARQRELQVGSRIQQTLLVTPTPSQLRGLQISSFSQASQGIDGDFVEVIQMGEHCVDLIAGDVMGKGLAAAMMGAGAKLQFSRSIAELLTQARKPGDLPRPADVVAAVHRAMTPALQSLDAFVTLCYLRIDTEQHTVTWVGCGHEETIAVGRDGQCALLPNQHPPLGVLDAADYVQDTRPLGPDELLFMCSDGVTDAMQANGERIGHQRMQAALLRQAQLHASPAAVLHSLRRDLLGPTVSMQDDVTLVVVKHQGSQPSQRIELALNMASLRPLREFVLRQTACAGLDELAGGLLEVACVEAFTNVVRHGQSPLVDAPAELLAREIDGELQLELIYLGAPFEAPQELAPTDFGAYPEGGFGLAIIYGASDRVEYLHVDGVNKLRLHKCLQV